MAAAEAYESRITMTGLIAIARNAFVETVRQGVYAVLIFLTLAVLVLDVPLSSWTMGQEQAQYKKTDQQLLVNLGLSTLLLSGLFVSAFGAAGVVSREIRDRTILTVVSKPLSRALVVAGKFLGVAAAVAVAYWLCSVAFLMTVRHGVVSSVTDPYDFPVIVLGCSSLAAAILAAVFCNYFLGWHFVASAVGFAGILMTAAMATIAWVGKGWEIVPFGQGIPAALPAAMLLMLFSNLVFAAVAVAASTRLRAGATLLACIGFFLIGIWGYDFFDPLGSASPAAGAVRQAWPELKFFYALEALVQEKSISASYVALAGAYALCLIVAILSVGMAMFQRRELEDVSSGSPLGVSILAVLGRTASVVGAVAAAVVLLRLESAASVLGGLAWLVGAVVGWVFWGRFARGAKWAYCLLGTCAVAAVGLSVARLAGAGLPAAVGQTATVAAGVAAVLVLLILSLAKTRYHFGLVRKQTKPRRAAV